MFYLTGDIHGDVAPVAWFCDHYNTTKNDTLIILGDAGLNFWGNKTDRNKKRFLQNLPIKLFCIHGNHEIRPQNIPTYKEGTFCGGKIQLEDEFPDILFAIDGEIYTINGKQSIVIGGAYSVDKYYRLQRGYGWWEDEQPSEEIKQKVESVLEKRGNKIDIVLSHTCPYKYEPCEAFLGFIDQRTVDNSTEKWLDKIEDIIEYEEWYCGHWHIDKIIDHIHFLKQSVVPFPGSFDEPQVM